MQTYWRSSSIPSIKSMDHKNMNRIRLNKHPKRKNNYIVAAMYAMYKRGPEGKPMSLAQIAKMYRKTRQSIHSVFQSRGYPLRSKEVGPIQVLDGLNFTETKDGYWRMTNKKRRLMHVYVWEKHNRRLPKKSGIHHKDLDRANNKIENLECLSIIEISSKHNPHFNQYTSPNRHLANQA